MRMSKFFQKKHVLVTGGTGFIGGHFVSQLLESGANVRATWHKKEPSIEKKGIDWIQADLLNQEDCSKVSQGIHFCIHAAGVSAGVGGDGKLNAVSKNLVMTSQMITAAATASIRKMLIFSSSTGYPPLKEPVNEDIFYQDDPDPSYWGYGWMRRYFERLSEFANQLYPTEFLICRPTAVYGEHYNYNPHTSHVIPALIHRAFRKEDPFVVWGRPDVVRDFLHVKDLVRGCLLLLEHGTSVDPVNIGYGAGTTIEKLVDLVLQAVGHSPVIRFDEGKPTSIPYRVANIDKARNQLGFEPRIPIDEGVQGMVSHLLEAS